jgi:hypothetical protein
MAEKEQPEMRQHVKLNATEPNRSTLCEAAARTLPKTVATMDILGQSGGKS